MGDHIPVIRLLLQQGQTLEVTGYEGALAKVTAGEEQGLVETGFLRFPDEPFESRTAYALWNAGLYPDFSCLGEPLEKLATNTKLEVLEELENCLYVQAGEKLGFVPLAQQSRYRYQAPADSGSGRFRRLRQLRPQGRRRHRADVLRQSPASGGHGENR